MQLAFPWPTTQGEWLAWSAAAFTVALGLVYLFAPRIALRAAGLPQPVERPQALAHLRGPMAGFLLAVGLAPVVLGQPRLYLLLGFAWAFTAFGRLVGMLSDGGGARNLVHFLIESLLAALALVFALGLVA